MKKSKVTVNFEGLEKFKAEMQNYRARVGVLGDKAARKEGDFGNDEIAVVQIYGSFEHNIPPRDFLLMPVEFCRREIVKAMTTSAVKAAIAAGNVVKVFKLLGKKAEQVISEAFETSGYGQWAPNSPVTVARKGSSMPLFDTGQLKAAVTSEVVNKQGQIQ